MSARSVFRRPRSDVSWPRHRAWAAPPASAPASQSGLPLCPAASLRVTPFRACYRRQHPSFTTHPIIIPPPFRPPLLSVSPPQSLNVYSRTIKEECRDSSSNLSKQKKFLSCHKKLLSWLVLLIKSTFTRLGSAQVQVTEGLGSGPQAGLPGPTTHWPW